MFQFTITMIHINKEDKYQSIWSLTVTFCSLPAANAP